MPDLSGDDRARFGSRKGSGAGLDKDRVRDHQAVKSQISMGFVNPFELLKRYLQ